MRQDSGLHGWLATGRVCIQSTLALGGGKQFIIVGEARSQALRIEPGLSSHISETRRIVALRNFLVHGYAKFENELIYGLMGKDVPTLQQELTSLLQ
jgi:uncharacterized protein with HEPN domain